MRLRLKRMGDGTLIGLLHVTLDLQQAQEPFIRRVFYFSSKLNLLTVALHCQKTNNWYCNTEDQILEGLPEKGSF